MFAWPDSVMVTLLGDEKKPRAERLRALAQEGASMLSYMAGKGTDGTCYHYINRALKKHGVIEQGMRDPLATVHANDVTPCCQDVLSSMHDGTEKIYKHVFGAQQSRFSQEVLDTLHSMKAAAQNNPEQKKLVYEEFKRYLLDMIQGGQTVER